MSFMNKLAAWGLASCGMVALISSCSANSSQDKYSGTGGGIAEAGDDVTDASAGSGGSSTDSSTDGLFVTDGSLTDVVNETPINICGSECGNTELCDPQHLGYDDNCNGQVDEGCPCTPGLSHWCFKGDPASRNKGACKDGVQKCGETG
ncbi:MAG TPA: hypothetical protein PLV85_11760, partial [Polyangiaceae bacterium]|nr:hypothetical protein [Polyangiaceae bacterium]